MGRIVTIWQEHGPNPARGAARAEPAKPARGVARAQQAPPGTLRDVRDRYRVVVIGGGIVGTSVAYHLARRGLTEVALLERERLTAGSSWHAAGGYHAINADPAIAELQRYTISMYPDIERESGQPLGRKETGGIWLAGTAERARWLRSELTRMLAQGHEGARLVSPEEAAELVPIIDPAGLTAALFDPEEGNLDPVGATVAYAAAARARGVEVLEHTRVTALARRLRARSGGGWTVTTDRGSIRAEHVINAGGLWARRVGRMVGLDHPIVPMRHHYLVTESIPAVAALDRPMPAVTDLEGFSYLQREGDGILLGIYEQRPVHWSVEGAPWDFGQTLFAEEIERILPELSLAYERFPALRETGVRRWVNGAFAFTPDGNPLVGPVDGLPGYWAACGVMAGFSQGAGIGLVLANWLADGDPGFDVFGMDVARFPAWASDDTYLLPMTAQFYARRFVMAYPNEELPAARPRLVTPASEAQARAGARWTVNRGLEVAAYFADDAAFEETGTLGRSNAEPLVAAEVHAVRTAAGAYEIAQYARYEVTGTGAAAWLDGLVAGRLPPVGRIRLAPMLSPAGHLVGDLSVTRLAEDRFWLTGSYALQEWHLRWFQAHLPQRGVTIRNRTAELMGFSVSGPAARAVLGALVAPGVDVAGAALPFLAVRELPLGHDLGSAVVGRISLTGELGFEIVVPAARQGALAEALVVVGADHGLRFVGDRAVDSLRLEKGYGIWFGEFRGRVTPAECGLERFVAFDKGEFVGREAALRARDGGARRLVLLAVEAVDADAHRDDPVRLEGRVVGSVTSGGFGHHVGLSLALALVERGVTEAPRVDLSVAVVGDPRPARILPEAPYDPRGERLRDRA